MEDVSLGSGGIQRQSPQPAGFGWISLAGFGSRQQHIKADEAEREIRAQIEKAMAMGMHPTHIDSHMGVFFSRPDLFAAYLRVAHEYKLPFLAVRTPDAPPALSRCCPTKMSCSTPSSWLSPK